MLNSLIDQFNQFMNAKANRALAVHTRYFKFERKLEIKKLIPRTV